MRYSSKILLVVCALSTQSRQLHKRLPDEETLNTGDGFTKVVQKINTTKTTTESRETRVVANARAAGVKKSTVREREAIRIRTEKATPVADRATEEESKAKTSADEALRSLRNYVNQVHFSKHGKFKGAYIGDKEKGYKISNDGYPTKIKVALSKYMRIRRSEYVDENVTPAPYVDLYEHAEEQIPSLVNQGYEGTEAPVVEPGGYRNKRAYKYVTQDDIQLSV